MTDYPRDRIAKSLQALDWQEATEETEWHDGQVALVAMPVHLDRRILKWTYEYALLRIVCGQDQNGEYCDLKCDGNICSFELNDITWYVEVWDEAGSKTQTREQDRGCDWRDDFPQTSQARSDGTRTG